MDPEEQVRALKIETDALRRQLRGAREDCRRAELEKQSVKKEMERALAAKQAEMDEVLRGVMVELREGEEEMRKEKDRAVTAKVKCTWRTKS